MKKQKQRHVLRDAIVLLLGVALGVLALTLPQILAAPRFCASGVQPVISPVAEDALLAFVNEAHESIDVELFEFSHKGMQDALIAAAKRGVQVRVLLEPRVQQNLKTAEYLKANGVRVAWASLEFEKTHSKFAVADSKRLLVGSLNWSRSALLRNREAGVIIDDENAARFFGGVFASDWQKATAA
jgi:phosphatidylserine/phosphatidylglycerophosphate/cardiolipin synthase-like enzyme